MGRPWEGGESAAAGPPGTWRRRRRRGRGPPLGVRWSGSRYTSSARSWKPPGWTSPRNPPVNEPREGRAPSPRVHPRRRRRPRRSLQSLGSLRSRGGSPRRRGIHSGMTTTQTTRAILSTESAVSGGARGPRPRRRSRPPRRPPLLGSPLANFWIPRTSRQRREVSCADTPRTSCTVSSPRTRTSRSTSPGAVARGPSCSPTIADPPAGSPPAASPRGWREPPRLGTAAGTSPSTPGPGATSRRSRRCSTPSKLARCSPRRSSCSPRRFRGCWRRRPGPRRWLCFDQTLRRDSRASRRFRRTRGAFPRWKALLRGLKALTSRRSRRTGCWRCCPPCWNAAVPRWARRRRLREPSSILCLNSRGPRAPRGWPYAASPRSWRAARVYPTPRGRGARSCVGTFRVYPAPGRRRRGPIATRRL